MFANYLKQKSLDLITFYFSTVNIVLIIIVFVIIIVLLFWQKMKYQKCNLIVYNIKFVWKIIKFQFIHYLLSSKTISFMAIMLLFFTVPSNLSSKIYCILSSLIWFAEHYNLSLVKNTILVLLWSFIFYSITTTVYCLNNIKDLLYVCSILNVHFILFIVLFVQMYDWCFNFDRDLSTEKFL